MEQRHVGAYPALHSSIRWCLQVSYQPMIIMSCPRHFKNRMEIPAGPACQCSGILLRYLSKFQSPAPGL